MKKSSMWYNEEMKKGYKKQKLVGSVIFAISDIMLVFTPFIILQNLFLGLLTFCIGILFLGMAIHYSVNGILYIILDRFDRMDRRKK